MRVMAQRTLRRSRLPVVVIFVTVSAIYQIEAFESMPPRKVSKMNNGLWASLSTPTSEMLLNDDDNDRRTDKMNKRTSKEANIHVVSMNGSAKQDPFRRYLERIVRGVHNKKKRAGLMYDALRDLEAAYYDLPQESSANLNDHPYDGPVVRPESRAYGMVINAYANARLGTQGAKIAEEVLERYHQFWGPTPNVFLQKAVMNAWLRAGDFSKAKEYLNQIEDGYGEFDVSVYTKYLDCLATANTKNKVGVADISMDVLGRARAQFFDDNSVIPASASNLYVKTMECQARSFGGSRAFSRVKEVFDFLEDDYASFDQHAGLKPSSQCVIPFAHAACKCKGSIAPIKELEKVLNKLESRFRQTGDADFLPKEQIYSLLLSSYGRVKAGDALEYSSKVESVLERMAEIGIKPGKYAISSAMMAKANDKTDKSLEVAESLFASMDAPDVFAYQCRFCRNGNAKAAEKYLKEFDNKFGADVMSIGSCLDAYSKNHGGDQEYAIRQAQFLLDDITNRYEQGLVGPFEKHVNSWVFEDLARMWVRSRKPDAGEQIVALIRRMEELHTAVPGLFHPTEDLYVLAMDAFSSSGQTGSAQGAMRLLEEMDVMAENKILPTPNIRILSSAVGALTRSNDRNVANDAYTIYQRLLSRIEEGDQSYKLHPSTMTGLFLAFFKNSKRFDTQKGIDVLHQTIRMSEEYPRALVMNTIVFNAVLGGLFRRQAADEAWSIFKLMKNLAKRGMKTLPDSATYSTMAKVVVTTKSKSAVSRLRRIVDEVAVAQNEGRLDLDLKLFNAILSGYSSLANFYPELASESVELLTRLERLAKEEDIALTPSMSSYKSVSLALARSKATDVAETILGVFRRAQTQSSNCDHVIVDRDFYFSVLSSLARDETDFGGIDKALEIVREMEGNRKNDKGGAVPDTRLYNFMISAIASSRDPDKVSKALSLFESMPTVQEGGDIYASPDIDSYNWVLLAASRSHSTSPTIIRRNFDVALEKFKGAHNKEEIEPNSLTYEFFVRSCINLLPAGQVQTTLIEKAFTLCRRRALVSANIVKLVHCYVPGIAESLETEHTHSFSKEGEKHTIQVIPSEWSSSIPARHRKRKVDLTDCDVSTHFVDL